MRDEEASRGGWGVVIPHSPAAVGKTSRSDRQKKSDTEIPLRWQYVFGKRHILCRISVSSATLKACDFPAGHPAATATNVVQESWHWSDQFGSIETRMERAGGERGPSQSPSSRAIFCPIGTGRRVSRQVPRKSEMQNNNSS